MHRAYHRGRARAAGKSAHRVATTRTHDARPEHGGSGRAPGETEVELPYAALAGIGAFCSAGLVSIRIR